MGQNTSDKLLTMKQVRDYLGVSLCYPYKLCDEGKLPSVDIPLFGKPGRYMRRVKKSDLDAFVEKHYQRGRRV